jgi:hypothetical protein
MFCRSLFLFLSFFLKEEGQTTQRPKEEGQTTQWPKEEGQTTQWPTEEGQTTQWPTEEGQTIQWPTEEGQTTLFLLAIVLSVHRLTVSEYSFGVRLPLRASCTTLCDKACQ